MESETFFQTFRDGTEEIVKSDRACADVLRWANSMSLIESSNPSFEIVAAFLFIGLDFEIKRMVQRLKSTKHNIKFSNSFETHVSEAERAYNEERGQLHTLQYQIPELLLQIIRVATNSEAIYLSVIEKHKNAPYEGTHFIVETGKRMQRYLEGTLLFLRSLDEAKVGLQQRNSYVSRIFEARRFLESDAAILKQTQVTQQAISTQEYLLSMLKTAELITFDEHIPRLTSWGIDLVHQMNMAVIHKTIFTPEEILAMPPGLKESFMSTVFSQESAIDSFVKAGILEADGQTVTDHGLKVFLGAVEKAFQNGFTGIAVSMVQFDASELTENGMDEILNKFEPTGSVIRRNFVAAILKSM